MTLQNWTQTCRGLQKMCLTSCDNGIVVGLGWSTLSVLQDVYLWNWAQVYRKFAWDLAIMIFWWVQEEVLVLAAGGPSSKSLSHWRECREREGRRGRLFHVMSEECGLILYTGRGVRLLPPTGRDRGRRIDSVQWSTSILSLLPACRGYRSLAAPYHGIMTSDVDDQYHNKPGGMVDGFTLGMLDSPRDMAKCASWSTSERNERLLTELTCWNRRLLLAVISPDEERTFIK